MYEYRCNEDYLIVCQIHRKAHDDDDEEEQNEEDDNEEDGDDVFS
jgi:hypothetical protein